MMGIESINEPGQGNTTMLTPNSINEPLRIPEGAGTPVITGIEPAEATIGQPDFTLYVTGTGFIAQSVIVFAGRDEPTTLEGDGTPRPALNMSVWRTGRGAGQRAQRSAAVERGGSSRSHPTRARHLAAAVADPDDLEDEIEQAEEEGDFKSTHPRRKKRR
jgi:hypothetical protein